MEDTIIRIENVSKQYRLGMIGGTMLRADLQRLGARLRRKEDPTRKLNDIRADEQKGKAFWALRDINLTVSRGETIGIIGRNGAGKSTLLKLLCRITAPTTGTIAYNGRIASLLEVGTGFHPELTGRENIYLNGAILGMNRQEINDKIDRIIEFSECEQFIDTPVKRYSSGMYVKLAFSVAAFLDAEIMIMDEVLAVGDAAFQQKCIRRMKELAEEEHRTILYVSHLLPTVSEFCNRCIVLDQGRIIFEGQTADAISHYLTRETAAVPFIDYSEMNRHKKPERHEILLLRADLEGKQEAVYTDDEPILLRLRFRYLVDCRQVSFRLELRTADGRTVGTSVREQFLSGQAGEEQSVLLRYDLPELAEGRYITGFSFFHTLQDGSVVNVETVDGISFEKRNDGRTKLQWDAGRWGSVRLASPEISEYSGT